MNLSYRQLTLGERHEVDDRHGHLQLLLGGGRAVAASISDGVSVWLALRGELPLETGEGSIVLAPGQMFVSTDKSIGTGPRACGLWLVLAGPEQAWKQGMAAVSNESSPDGPSLFPYVATCPAELRKLLLRLVRSARQGNSPGQQTLLFDAAMASLRSTQTPLRRLAERCSGRTHRLRQQNLLRLLRARHRIRMNPCRRMDLPSLAATANYSPWHFIRAFREVFGEAPCEYANRKRLEHARDLLTSSRMTVSEIAGLVGYDSRSAFCRSFRNAFDMTASQVRSRAQADTGSRRSPRRRAASAVRAERLAHA